MEIVRTIHTNQETMFYTYADLVEKYSDSVYKLCRSLTYSKEDAEDLFQETYFRAFEQLSKLNDSDNPQGFLMSTCIYIWKGWKRKHARRNRLAPLTLVDETIASDEQTEAHLLAEEETVLIRGLVEALPEKFRMPTILYYTLEMSVPDIAGSLKLPAGTVKSRLFKARKLIEKGLVENHYEK